MGSASSQLAREIVTVGVYFPTFYIVLGTGIQSNMIHCAECEFS